MKAPPPGLEELTQEQFALWRQHPVSALLLRHFLPDYRKGMIGATVANWVAGRLSLNAEQEARGYILTLDLFETLTVDKIRTFYGLMTFERQAEAERRQKARPNVRGY